MDYLFSAAFYEGIWRIVASVAAATILILCLSTSASSALLIAAHVAMLFSVLMIRNAAQFARLGMKDGRSETIPWTESRASVLTLGFAKAGSGIAAALSGAALIV